MRCPLLLILLLGAAQGAPFFKLRFWPEHRTGEEGASSTESDSPFVFRVPKIILDILRPLMALAGRDVNNIPLIGIHEGTEYPEDANCDLARFNVTHQEFDIVQECKTTLYRDGMGVDKVQLKECMLKNLPKTTVELRDFLDREEFGGVSVLTSNQMSLINGEFTQRKSLQVRTCRRDEVNSIDRDQVSLVEEMVPIEVLNSDRVDAVDDVAEP